MSFNKSWTPTSNNALNLASALLLNANIWVNYILQKKLAGWTVDGSSNGGRSTVTDSAGSKNIAFVSGTTWTLTDTVTNGFTADMVGCLITLSGFSNGGNNHAFRVIAFTDAGHINFAQGAFTPVNETAASGAHWSLAADAGIDQVDRLSSGAPNFAWNSGGSAHWWVILKSPAAFEANGNFVWQVIQGSTGSSNPHLVNMGDASAAYTAGSTTADPTAPTNNRAFSNKQVTNSTNANSKWHCTYSTVGDMAFFVSRNGTGWAAFCDASLSFTLGNEPSGSPAYDQLHFHSFVDSGQGGDTGTNWGSSTQTTMYNKDATVTTTMKVSDWRDAVAGQRIPAQWTNSNGVTNVSGLVPNFPMSASVHDASKMAYKGECADIVWAVVPTVSVLSKTDPSTVATVNWAVMGDHMWPFPGITSDPQF